MFRGSPGLSAAALAAITAEMGGSFDATTRQMTTQYTFTVPTDQVSLPLKIEALRMRGSLANEASWKQERLAIEQEVAQDLSNPQYLLYNKLLGVLFRDTPYAHDALGTKASFDRTSGAMLKRFHDTWYAPNNAILVIAGNVRPQQVLAEVKREFAGISARKLPPKPVARLHPVVPATISMPTNSANGIIGIAFQMPGYNSPDYAAAQVLADVLSSQRGDLYDLVPAGKALSASFSYNGLPQAGMGIAQAAFPLGGDPQKLIQEVRQVLTRTVHDGVSPELVEAAKRQEIAANEFQKNSVSGLAATWSDALAVEGRQSPQDDIRMIRQVTVADVNRVARRYLDQAHSVTAILTPQSSGGAVPAQGFGGKETFAPRQGSTLALPAWAKRSLSRLDVPPSTLHPVSMILPNGLRLIVQPETINHTVSVYGRIKNQPLLQVPPGKEGLGSVLDMLFSYGTTHLDRLAFQKALDDIAAQESGGTDFALQVLDRHFDRGVALLADHELHPALPADAFHVVQQQVAAMAAGQLQSPSYLTGRALRKRLFPPQDPTLRQTTPATVQAITLADVKRYYQQAFRPDLTTIVVIGNITPAHARAAIEKYFGSWQAQGSRPATDLPPVPLNHAAAAAVPDRSRVQDRVILAETLGLTRKQPDYYALQLGNHVLGGAFYATRLYHDLREATGLVYFVNSSFNVGKQRATYSVEYACDPGNVSRVRAIVQRDLRDMQARPVSVGELRRAKALLLREIPLSESSVDSIAGGFLNRVALDLPLDEPEQAAHRYMHLDRRQVQAAFRRWLRVGDLVQVSQGPLPH